MKTISNKELGAMVRLLADQDNSIYEHIYDQLIKKGTTLIPQLQKFYEVSSNRLVKERLELLLNDLKLKKLKSDLIDWKINNSNDLLAGAIRIARFGDPTFDSKEINNLIDEIAVKIKPHLNDIALHNARIFNKVILDDFGFQGNFQDYQAVENSFIDKVIQNRKGNPIMLSVIYLLVAERLNISMVGINSPRHFLVASASSDFDWTSFTTVEMLDNIDFYIDPFYNGKIYDHGFFDNMLINANFDLKKRKYLLADNSKIIKRIMNNLIYGLHILGEKKTAHDLMLIAAELDEKQS